MSGESSSEEGSSAHIFVFKGENVVAKRGLDPAAKKERRRMKNRIAAAVSRDRKRK
jgi:hypothetical protein